MTEKLNIINEPIKSYQAGSKERISLQKKYDELSENKIEIPIIINGEKIKTGDIGKCVMPHDHQEVLATYHKLVIKWCTRLLSPHLMIGLNGPKLILSIELKYFVKRPPY